MAELKPFEVIMRIDYAASKGPEVVVHAEKVQELVRCKDCKWGDDHEMGVSLKNHIRCDMHDDGYEMHEPDWFCPDGRRKNDD